MFKNLSKMLFMLMMGLGTLISISANTWLGIWMGLEVNLLSFIPIITNINNLNNSEASLNYFLIQAFASSIILFSMIFWLLMLNLSLMNIYYSFYLLIPMKLMILTLMMKLGAAPFHFWFPNVMENISWANCFILMTWQKLAPMIILFYLMEMKMNNFLMIFIILSSMIGAIGGLNQLSLRKLLAFSSINHMGWMFMTIMFNENLWLTYFIIYTFLNFYLIMLFKIFKIFYLNQLYSNFMNSYIMKFNFMIPLLSLGGLPPFLGFIPKWLTIQAMIFMNMYLINMILICMSMITLYYYLKISFSSLMMNYNELNWIVKNHFNNSIYKFMLLLNFLTLMSLFLCIELIY